MAQAAAIAACEEQDFVEASRRKILADRERLRLEIQRLGFATVQSTAGFFLVLTGHASELRKKLLARHHILVRDCTSFGLPEFIRIAARPADDCGRLTQALKEESTRC